MKTPPTALGEYVVTRSIEKEEQEVRSPSGIIVETEERKRKGDYIYLKRGKFISKGAEVKQDFRDGHVLLYSPFDANTYFDGDDEYDAVHIKHVKAVL